MSNVRRLRASLSAVLALGVALSLAAPADAAPPKRVAPITIGVNRVSPTNAANATFTFSTTTKGATYSCSFDGAKAAPCTSPKTYPPSSASRLTQGTHTLRVVASAPGFTKPATASASVTVDLTPPAAPTVSAVPAITNNDPALAPVKPTFGDTSTDVASYRCTLDGSPYACSSGAQIAATPDGSHTLAVWAVDKAGNRSLTSTSVHWLVDTFVAKPVISGGPALVTASVSEKFYFEDADADAVLSCSVNSAAAFAPCTSGGVLTGKNGSNTLVVKATDGVGNVALSDTYAWTVDPSTKYSLHFDGGTLPATLTNQTGGTVNFSVSPAPATVACDVDGAALSCAGSAVTYSSLADGTHRLTVAVDKGQPTANAISFAWTVDTVAPGRPTLSGPPARTNATTASVSVVPASLGDAVTCTADGAPVACSAIQPVSMVVPLVDGPHTVVATEHDRAGNISSSTLTWTVDTVAPTATISTQTAITGFQSVVLNEDGTAAGTSPSLTLSTGAAVATRRVCLSSTGAGVSCSSTSVRTVRLYGASPLVPGESYVVKVNAPGATPLTDAAGNRAPSSSTGFRAATLQQENSPATSQTWRRIAVTAAKGGSYLVEGRSGATATWTFSGTSVTAWLVAGPTFGYAKVYVDGVLKGTFNQYASSQRYTSGHTIRGLAAGGHRVTVVVTGTKGSKVAKGANVGVDAFSVGATMVASPALTQRWAVARATAASGGARALGSLVGETFSMTFAGTRVSWARPVGVGFGIAAVYVDGVLKAKVDSYATSSRERIVWSSALLVSGRHSIKIVVLGTKRAAAKGTTVGVDYLQVR